jgi:hypothetical protein
MSWIGRCSKRQRGLFGGTVPVTVVGSQRWLQFLGPLDAYIEVLRAQAQGYAVITATMPRGDGRRRTRKETPLDCMILTHSLCDYITESYQ